MDGNLEGVERATVAREVPPLLEVRDLTVAFPRPGGGDVLAVDGVGFRIGPGEAVGLLGESGCGKTTTALALVGLLPPAARVLHGSVAWRGEDLLSLDERRLQRIRGAEVSFLFQEPALALNPVLRVGDQIAEVARAHMPWSPARCREEAEALLVRLGLPARTYAAYPHELSGGQRQRVAVAQAVVCGPALMIADEPTTALDAVLKADLLRLLADLRQRLGLALLVISHDLSAVAAVAGRVLVMHAGRIVEQGPVDRVFASPLHDYTRALLDAVRVRSFPHGG